MAKFAFKFQSLLSIREKLETQKELEYGAALKKLEDERAAERELKQRKIENVEAFRLSLEKRINREETQMYNAYTEVLKDRIALQIKLVKAAEEQAERKRLELVEAMRARKTLEKLKENDYEEYTEEEKRGEQKQVDQTVSYKYARE